MKSKVIYFLAFAAVMAVVLVTGAHLREAEKDDRIDSLFKRSHAYKTFLKDDSIKAEARDGVVTLTGTAAEESHKALARKTVLSLPGVTRVDDQLAIKGEVNGDNADALLGRRIKVSLFFNRNVITRKATVGVKDGIVTLTGEAASVAQKKLTAEYVRDIEGVKEVKNEMMVAAPEAAERTANEKMDDASIGARVKTPLLIQRPISSMTTDLRVMAR